MKTYTSKSLTLLFHTTLITTLFINCGPSADQTLGAFDGGEVKRSEMRQLMQLELGEDAASKATIAMQTTKVRQIAMMKIGALAFDKSGQKIELKEQKMAKLRKLEAQQLAYSYILKNDASDFEITMHELQFLSLNQTPTSPKRVEEGNAYLKELNSGKLNSNEIEDFIQKKSEHGRYRWLGGYMDPVCSECNPNAGLQGLSMKKMVNKLNKTKEGQFVMAARPASILIFRKVNTKIVKLDDLEDYLKDYFRKTMKLSKHYAAHATPEQKSNAQRASMFKDQKQLETTTHQISERQKQEVIQKITRVKMEQLRLTYKFKWKLQDQKILIEFQEKKGNNDINIFSINKKNYKMGQLKKDLADLGLDKEKKGIFSIINGVIIPKEILNHDPVFNKIKNSKEYDFFYKLIQLRIKNQAYFGKMPIQEPTAKEIREFYKKQKKNAKGKGPSFADLKEKIIAYLSNQKRSTIIKKHQQELSQKYKLKIFTKNLIANTI